MFIEKLEAKLAAKAPRTILFIDGTDERAIKAVREHVAKKLIKPLLLVEKASDITHANLPHLVTEEVLKTRREELIALYLKRRKGKEDLAQAEKAVLDKHVIAMLLLELGEVDGVIGGLNAPTADILRPAFKIIGPAEGIKTISSVMVMHDEVNAYVFSDISVNIKPDATQLADIGVNAALFAKRVGLPQHVAFLSFSTSGSAAHEDVTRVAEATKLFNDKHVIDQLAIGEVQFDAAFDQKTRELKYHGTSFHGAANVYIFPDLGAGNIGYKIAQRLGKMGAIGPIIVGINKPVNDLSRGATADDVYYTAMITAGQH